VGDGNLYFIKICTNFFHPYNSVLAKHTLEFENRMNFSANVFYAFKK